MHVKKLSELSWEVKVGVYDHRASLTCAGESEPPDDAGFAKVVAGHINNFLSTMALYSLTLR